MKIKIGIPKALLYYEYGDLWDTFFRELGCDIVYSPASNKNILEGGKALIIDESCLALKVFIGHVKYLEGKCDYLLIPRIDCLRIKETTCTNFQALYDLVNTLFDIKILDYNVDVKNGETLEKGLRQIALKLGFDKKRIKEAYACALEVCANEKSKRTQLNKQKLKKEDSLKILLVAHPYNIYDELIGKPVIAFLETLGIEIILAYQNEKYTSAYKRISKTLYWTFNKKLLNGIVEYEGKVDGIILLTVFPCGPDSLVNEAVTKWVKKPVISIIVDELNAQAGLETRLESFVDMLSNIKGVVG